MAPILTNHIGYDCGDTKSAVYQRQSDETPASFRVICDKTGAVCFEGAPVETGEVDNWVLGLNPFDSCMLEGEGRNNIDYFFEGAPRDFIQRPGGIVNGITSGLHDDHSIAYYGDPAEEVDDNWRGAEQWIPHATWYMYALCMKKSNDGKCAFLNSAIYQKNSCTRRISRL